MTEEITVGAVIAEIHQRCGELDASLAFLREKTIESAQAEHDYRKERALRFLEADGAMDMRAASADAAAADLRLARDLAQGLREAAMEAVRSRRAQVSAAQTIGNLLRAEFEIAGKGPQREP